MFNKYDHIKGLVETYIDLTGNLIICNPSVDIHWDYYESKPLIETLTDLLEDQLANGFSWIRPEEIGEKKGVPILGWDVQHNDQGGYAACYDIFRLPDYQLKTAIKDLQEGKVLKFHRVV